MIVVSNTSPLTNLAAIGQFGLLHRLYGQVYIGFYLDNALYAHALSLAGEGQG